MTARNRSWIPFHFIQATLLFCIGSPPVLSAPQLGTDPVRDVIAAMTLEEKVGLVLGTGMNFPGLPPERQGPDVGRTSERVPGAAGQTLAIPRLGIPSIVLADGPAGLRIQPLRDTDPDATFYCTAFPIATLLASTWDTDLVERVGRAVGNEIREYGVDVLLAPALNLHRFPLGGRNFEYYSEDPLLSGKMTAAMIRGVQSQGVGTSIKHYAANNHEWNRGVINVIVDERTLREIYLRGFEIAVREGRPWTVMSSYNKVNGSYTSESGRLLTTVLRQQWGFDGLVMTDWFGGSDAVAQMDAGNDLLMPGTIVQQRTLLAAMREGRLDDTVLNRNIENILNVILRTPAFRRYEYSDRPDLQSNAAVARMAAAEGMVLLKNSGGTLPLPSGLNIALFGNTSYDIITGGTGSGDVNEAYSISLQQGLADAGYALHADLEDRYARYIAEQTAARPPVQRFRMPPPIAEREVPADEIRQLAASSDMAVITLGRNSGEFADRKAEGDFYLSGAEQGLIANVAKEFHERGKKVVVILNIGGVIETASWRDKVDAVLLAWQSGQEAGHAVADVLNGSVSPSGRLADSFAMKLEDYPAAANFPGVVLAQGNPDPNSLLATAEAAEVRYAEELRVGYRHFISAAVETAYPFGYGLSYTEFDYSDLSLSSAEFNESISATVTVTNTGRVPGREVVQVYVAAPPDGLSKPARELRAFGKTGLLQPGQSQILSFTLAPRDLASYDVSASAWLVAAGSYTVMIGRSAADIVLSEQFRKRGATRIKP